MTDITENPDARQRIVAALKARAQQTIEPDFEPQDEYHYLEPPRRVPQITDVAGRLPQDDPWTVTPKPQAGVDTETLLNGLIEECGFLMKEVVFRMMCRTEDHATRLSYIGRAMALAETGAKVGDAVARLRSGPVVEARQRVIVERVERGEGRGVHPDFANQ